MQEPTILAIALPTPLRRLFDYLPPAGCQPPDLRPGQRLLVSFGRQQLVGVLIAIKSDSNYPVAQLKQALQLIDTHPCLPNELLELCKWSSAYYHHSLGDTLTTALPTLLRQGTSDSLPTETFWHATTTGLTTDLESLKKAKKQQLALSILQQGAASKDELDALKISKATLQALIDKSLAETIEHLPADKPNSAPPGNHAAEPALTLNPEQVSALNAIDSEGFGVYLLQGATGSGKTEIYLQAIAKVLDQGLQALVLVPEIGLTPQTILRFRQRFHTPISILHSGMNDKQRLDAWLRAREGLSRIIIGTRSAIWTPIPQLGIVIIDEEHDLSFKQQDGLRYSARDLAAIRCQKRDIPLVLGSATPSLESLHNANHGRYKHIFLHQRAGHAIQPTLEIQDIRQQTLDEGLSIASLEHIKATIDAGNQVLVFINRRGFAPTLTCHDCGWQAHCPHCDARLTVHQHPPHLHCHHCDHQRSLWHNCQRCHSRQLVPVGHGTERSERALSLHFPDTPVIRVDRDSTRRKHAMDNILEQVHTGNPCILVGTQMLAKGHHFPDVTLVVIVDADSGLFSADFRGAERMGQLLLQVAGRAGREQKPGHVIIQTHLPEHPLLQTLVHQGFTAFAELISQERQLTELPPYCFMALVRAEATQGERANHFLQDLRRLASTLTPRHPIQLLGPLPAPMERRNQLFRYQLQLTAPNRRDLHQILQLLVSHAETLPAARRVRWSVDIDPLDMN